MLDTFSGANGPLSSAWQDLSAGYRVSDGQMRVNTGDRFALWNTTFGPAQEAYLTMNAVDVNSTEMDLILKAQGNSWSNGALTLYYYPAGHIAQIWTYSPGQSWQQHGLTYALDLQPGDVFGGRIYANGLVEMYHNGAIIASVDVSSWQDVGKPSGRAGIWQVNAPNTIMDNFGAGNVPSCNRTVNSNVVSDQPAFKAAGAFPMGVQTRAAAEEDGIHVTWSFYRTQPIAQFKLLRSDSADRSTALEVNTMELAGQSTVQGSYSFVDTDSQTSQMQSTRSYWLQVMYADGQQEEIGPILVEAAKLPGDSLYLPMIWR